MTVLKKATDFLGAFAELDDSQHLVADTVKQFVDGSCRPYLNTNFEQGVFRQEWIREMGDLGILGGPLQGYGCPGLDPISYGLVMRELERGDSGLRSFASVQSSLAMFAIHEFGSDQQKREFLPPMAAGEFVGCFGLTEPDHGSDPARLKTFARKKGNSWVLNGTKTWITNACIADVSIVWAQTDEGIRGFLVEKGAPGFSTTEIHHKLSLRNSVTGSLFFQNCEIPESRLLKKTEGLKSALSCLSQARFGIVFGVLGAAEDCLEESLAYVSEREVFGRPLAACQLVQRKLALMTAELAKAGLLALRLACLKNTGTLHPAQISLAKQNNVQMALDCARTARDLLGANGISGEYRSMRHMCNLEAVSTYEGTNDIHLLVVGQSITGQNAFG